LQRDVDALGDLSEEFDPFVEEEELDEELDPDVELTEEFVRIHMTL